MDCIPLEMSLNPEFILTQIGSEEVPDLFLITGFRKRSF